MRAEMFMKSERLIDVVTPLRAIFHAAIRQDADTSPRAIVVVTPPRLMFDTTYHYAP